MTRNGYTVEEPKASDGGMHDRYRLTHPAFGQIAADRITGTPGAVLYGTEFRHSGWMRIALRRSELSRGTSHDYPFARDEVVEVWLSEAQWAAFVSTPNSGQGVQCTIQHVEGERMPQLPEPRSTFEDFRDEMSDDMRKVVAHVDSAIASIEAESGLSKRKREALAHGFKMARQAIVSNLPYRVKEHHRHMETVVQHAKVEVEAYIAQAVARAGRAALAAGIEADTAPIALPGRWTQADGEQPEGRALSGRVWDEADRANAADDALGMFRDLDSSCGE